jgi:hypothetical protein
MTYIIIPAAKHLQFSINIHYKFTTQYLLFRVKTMISKKPDPLERYFLPDDSHAGKNKI